MTTNEKHHDLLARVITWQDQFSHGSEDQALVAEIIRALQQPRPIITEPEHLDQLPESTVVLSSEGGVWEAYGAGEFREYMEVGARQHHPATDIAFPVTVLHAP